MTPDTLAKLHTLSFQMPRPWSADEFDVLLDQKGVFLLTQVESFLMGRVIADEAELLTLAVHPGHRRQGVGATLVGGFVQRIQDQHATTAFLEVSEANRPAIRLYTRAGFEQVARRAGYYKTDAGVHVDALILRRNIAQA